MSVHLSAGAGRTADLSRQAETQKLLGFAGAYQASAHVPVIYLGDFNSHEGHALDGPGVVDARRRRGRRRRGRPDSESTAGTTARTSTCAAPCSGHWDIDHVYAPAGVAVRGWALGLTLTAGTFVGAIPSDHNPVVADVILPY